MRFLQVKRILNFSEISKKNLSRIIPKKPWMRFKEVLLPAIEDEVEKDLTSSKIENKLAEFASREQVEITLLDELEDTIDASDSDAELNALQTA